MRNRDIAAKVYYSIGNGSAPLIIFSPGFGGDRDGYEYLGRAWSEAGYVVVVVTHPGGDKDAVRKFGAKLERDPATSYQLQVDRTKDISHLLNSIDAVERTVPALRDRIAAS